MAGKNAATKTAEKTSPPKEPAKQGPALTLRYGLLRATIWRQQGESPWYSVVFSRSFQRDSSWESTSSFGLRDLLVVAKLASEAHTAIHRLMLQDKQGQQGNGSLYEAEEPPATADIPF